jgi:superfamily II DNA/RNA helicase
LLLQLIEKLYRARWTKLDGLGALVLTPTRELALQIFEELVKVRELLPTFKSILFVFSKFLCWFSLVII